MHFSIAIRFLALTSTLAVAAPIPQGAGVGAGCDAILTDGDTGSGLLVKEAGQNAASLLKSAGAKRQGAGVGDGCNAILTDGDTGSGLAVKEAGQNVASLLKSAGVKRQGDKAGAGTAAIIGLISPDAAAYQEGLTDVIDGDGTSDSAVIGQQVGVIEAQAGSGAGNLVPSKVPAGAKRQVDKAGAGTAAIISLVSPDAAAYQEGLTDVIDGDGTSDSAVIGQQIGVIEAQAGSGAGNLVPSKLPTTPKTA
ncbi:hypothetical protein ONS95_014664 [Cadophora gregata]|uniref:uncharacterized protein n=1 Tax=Cadophora gregata TaxID=51156 RepID=UPI0026DCBC92|nr:uncharacterized protein ONS95_014664 [Cadophora gregata]KAK0112946.1 hypothetical protein ONS95_014664 [Cadophora gregata]KAK0125071.1 hypothetical protein ONS96_008939 [Cadophora gregata f. sp. sojae]